MLVVSVTQYYCKLRGSILQIFASDLQLPEAWWLTFSSPAKASQLIRNLGWNYCRGPVQCSSEQFAATPAEWSLIAGCWLSTLQLVLEGLYQRQCSCCQDLPWCA